MKRDFLLSLYRGERLESGCHEMLLFVAKDRIQEQRLFLHEVHEQRLGLR